MPNLAAARAKAMVCGRSLAGNSSGDMDVCLLQVLCVAK